MKKFPFNEQFDSSDCGLACLAMIAQFYGRAYPVQKFREMSHITRTGVSMLGLADAAEAVGLKTLGVRLAYDSLAGKVNLPCIAHWKQRHFITIYKIKGDNVYVADPAQGLITYSKKEFLAGWASTNADGVDQGFCLLLEPTSEFYSLP